MLRRSLPRAMIRCVASCVFGLTAATMVQAADLDNYGPGRGGAYGNRGFADAHPGCRVIPQPQLNLWGEVTSYHPMWVCQSRGLLADTMPPPPPPPPLDAGGIVLKQLHDGIKADVEMGARTFHEDARDARRAYQHGLGEW